MIWYYIIIIYKCGPCPDFDELYPGFCLTTEGKTRRNRQLGYQNTQYIYKQSKDGTNITYGITVQNKKKLNHKSQYKIIHSLQLSAKQHILLFTVIKNHNGIHISLYTVIKIHNKQTKSHNQNHCTLRFL